MVRSLARGRIQEIVDLVLVEFLVVRVECGMACCGLGFGRCVCVLLYWLWSVQPLKGQMLSFESYGMSVQLFLQEKVS